MKRTAIPDSTNGIVEPPDQRVSRWASLFTEERDEVHHAAARRRLAALELQEALYLAGRLFSTVTGLPISRVDDFDFRFH